MTEPNTDPRFQPFEAVPFDTSDKPVQMGGGCGRVALIGCGLLILLLGIGAVWLVLNADDFLIWAMNRMKAEVVASVPADCTEEARNRLVDAFDAAIGAIAGGDVDPATLQDFVGAFHRYLPDASGELDCEQVEELTLLLERVAGVPSDTPEADAGPDVAAALGATS